MEGQEKNIENGVFQELTGLYADSEQRLTYEYQIRPLLRQVIRLFDIHKYDLALKIIYKLEYDSQKILRFGLYDVLGSIYTTKGDILRDRGFIKGIKGAYWYYQKALKIWKHLNYKERICMMYVNLGACCEMSQSFQQAIYYFDLADTLAESIEPRLYRIRTMSLTRIGCILTKLGHFDQAEKILRSSKSMRENKELLNNSDYITQKIAIVERKRGRYDKAFKIVEECDTRISESQIFRRVQSLILKTDISMSAGDTNNALEYAIKATNLGDKYNYNHQIAVLNSIVKFL